MFKSNSQGAPAGDLSACSVTAYKSPSVSAMTLLGPEPGPAQRGGGEFYHIVVRVDHQQST